MANQGADNRYDHGQSSGSNKVSNTCDCQGITGIPPGFRFCPSDEELIHYLKCKLKGLQSPDCKHIEEIDIYAYSPMELSEKYKLDRESEWYFYTLRTRKYPNGDRPNRFANGGFWKPTASGKSILLGGGGSSSDNGRKIGYVRTLNFRKGFEKNNTDQKTEWLMHEYTLDNKKLGKWVLVKIYKKRGASKNAEEEGKNIAIQEIVNPPQSQTPPLCLEAPESHNQQAQWAPSPSDDAPKSHNHQAQWAPSQQLEHALFWTPKPIQVVEPSLEEYYMDMNMGLHNAAAFEAQEAQQSPLPQTYGLNDHESLPTIPSDPAAGSGKLSAVASDQICWTMEQLKMDGPDSKLVEYPDQHNYNQTVPKPPYSEHQGDWAWLDCVFDFDMSDVGLDVDGEYEYQSSFSYATLPPS